MYKHLWAMFVINSIWITALIAYRYSGRYVDGHKVLGKLVVLKFVLQDFPQQIMLLTYFVNW